MTGMTFNGVRLFSDGTERECMELAIDEGSYRDSYHVPTYERCLDEAFETAVENAHDEWWDASAPERWEGYEPVYEEPLPRAA